MKRINLIGTTLIGIFFLTNLTSCNRGINSKGNHSNLNSDTKRDSTAYVLRGDTLLPPLKYKTEELGDFQSITPSMDKGSPPAHLGAPSGNYSFDRLKDEKYLHFLDGKMLETKKKEKILKKLKAGDIDTIQMIPADEAIELYGQKAAYGVIIIETKKTNKAK